MLGRQLNWQGYTVFAPLLSGHGGDPRKVLESNGPGDWWDDTRMAIFRLRDAGIDQIAILVYRSAVYLPPGLLRMIHNY